MYANINHKCNRMIEFGNKESLCNKEQVELGLINELLPCNLEILFKSLICIEANIFNSE